MNIMIFSKQEEQSALDKCRQVIMSVVVFFLSIIYFDGVSSRILEDCMLGSRAENFVFVLSKFQNENSEGPDRLIHSPSVDFSLFSPFLGLVNCQVRVRV